MDVTSLKVFAAISFLKPLDCILMSRIIICMESRLALGNPIGRYFDDLKFETRNPAIYPSNRDTGGYSKPVTHSLIASSEPDSDRQVYLNLLRRCVILIRYV